MTTTGTDGTMAWGVMEPSGFGEYFPDANYVGWDEAIRAYYAAEMSDAEKAAMGMADRVLLSRFSLKFTEDRGPIPPQIAPTHLHCAKSYKSLASLLITESRLLAVDGRLKAVIEELEPGVHQFWPIRITMPRGQEYPEPYFVLVIRQYIDSFVPEASERDAWEKTYGNDNQFRVRIPTKKYVTGLALSIEAIGGAYLWREKRLVDPRVYVSDRPTAEIARLGLRIPKHFRLREV